MRFEAPHPAVQTVSILPDPEFSDGEGLTDEVISHRAMDGHQRTYVKTKGDRRTLQWTLLLTRPKALELRAFLRSYFASAVRVVDHNNRAWVGRFINNPFELRSDRRADPGRDTVRGETLSITIEFEGVEQ